MRSLLSVFLVVLVLSQLAFVPKAEGGSAATLEYVNSALWSGVNDVVSRGSYVFAAFQYGLQVIDITNPAEPRSLSQLYLPPGGFVGIAIQGNYVYLAASMAGVAIVDIADPLNPRLVSWHDTPGSAVAVVADGSYLYVADTWAGLQVVNVSDPGHPVVEGTYDTPGDARGIAKYGDHVLIADGYDGGLQIVNVAMPQIPYPAGHFNTDGIARSVAVDGPYAYVADADGGVVILDLTDPTTPVRKSTYPQSATRRYAGDVAVHDGIVYYTAGYLIVVDASDPDNPQLVDTVSEAGYCSQVDVSDGRLCAFYPDQGVRLLDIQVPAVPALLGQFRVPGKIEHLAVSDSVLVAGDDPNGMRLLDISDPSNPEEVSFVPALMECLGVAVRLNHAYFADADSGTHIIDITDPRHPSEVGRLWSTKRDMEVTCNSEYLCISGYNAGNSFYRLSDPLHPLKIGTYNASFAARTACDGHHGYVAARYYGFQVVNLEDSVIPFREGLIEIPGSFCDIVLDSPYAYLAHEEAGLVIADISDPANPVWVGWFGFGGYPGKPRATGVAHNADLAFLAADVDGIWAIDVSNPKKPLPIATYNTPGNAAHMVVSGDYVYVADRYGVIVLKITRPTDAGEGNPKSMPGEIRLAQNYPNPFNPLTTIEFTLPRRTHVQLAIYNILGQEVIELVNSELTAGIHSVAWDGRDTSGKTVASGVYLYRISTGRATAARKMLLLK